MSPFATILVLSAAGACGSVARYGLAEWTARRYQGSFPLATFLINISGAFVLGLLLSLGGDHVAIMSQARPILGTGFLGGYTTFSTLSFETNALARRGLARHAWLNAAGTLLAGVIAAAAGMLVGAALA